MSLSSSGSWSARAPAAGDIIDLDRFMRSARPTRHARDAQLTRAGQLVVDGGSLSRKPLSSASSSTGAGEGAGAGRGRDKRFSHDSGLSDGSYARRRRRSHRRVSGAASASRREAGARDSASSMRAFRTACERALRDQQQAIARVAQLCERLGERREAAPDSSELSSSSRSSRDQRAKDKNRTEECKTYKIIMTKLDELNRLFVARGRSPPARADACQPRADACQPRADASPPKTDMRPVRSVARRDSRRARESLSSISVSDKLVSTEPQPPVDVIPTTQMAPRSEARARPARLAVADVAALDIAPRAPAQPKHLNVRTESVVKCSSAEESSSAAGYDLDNPVRLYTQAKRLQALHAAADTRARACTEGARAEAGGAARAAGRAWAGCVRALRGCLAAPLCCPAGWM